MLSFKQLNLIDPILKALDGEGYSNPTEIQEKAIPAILNGKDIFGCAQTGTGKTAAFSIPVLQLLSATKSNQRNIRALILAPTRELAIQIGESISSYGKYTGLKHTVIFGGVNQKSQTDALRKGVDILVATPGRLLDLINQRYIYLDHVEFFVLDEADRMLDMGFVHEIKKVIRLLPSKRQSLYFSATMPGEIMSLAGEILKDPIKVEVTPVSSAAETVGQSVFMVEKKNKKELLIDILNEQNISTALVFTRTKHGADKVAKDLNRAGIKADAIHGNKSQNARQKALAAFKSGGINVLVATDIAARGIDIAALPFVFNFDLPNEPETYVHRIGRTGRAGATGIAYSFCDSEERPYLNSINKLIGKNIQIKEHALSQAFTASTPTPPKEKTKSDFTKRWSGNKSAKKRFRSVPVGR